MKTYTLIQRTRAKGVALIVGLIFLIVLTIFVLGGLRDVLLQERMAGAFRNNSLAQSGVDSLLKNAEVWIFDNVTTNGLNFNKIRSVALDNEITTGSAETRAFRNGTGFLTNGAVLTPVHTSSPDFLINMADETSRRSTPGAYILEGPFLLEAPNTAGKAVESHDGEAKEGKKGELNGWRITARATGGSNDFVKVAEATFVIAN